MCNERDGERERYSSSITQRGQVHSAVSRQTTTFNHFFLFSFEFVREEDVAGPIQDTQFTSCTPRKGVIKEKKSLRDYCLSFQGHTDDYKKTSINILSTILLTTRLDVCSLCVCVGFPTFLKEGNQRKNQKKNTQIKGGGTLNKEPQKEKNKTKKGKRNFHLMGQSNLYFLFSFEISIFS